MPTNDYQKGMLIILSAPSGCGKTTIVDRLLKRHPEWLRSVSVTTRAPRMGEKESNAYTFVSPQVFKKMEQNGEFLETAKVFDRYYGTPKANVMKHLAKGECVLLAIDVQGTKKIKKLYDKKINMTTVFILPPSVKILRERLVGRNTESAEEINQRIETAQEEIKEAKIYDLTIVNQNLEQTVLDIEHHVQRFLKERRKKSNVVRTA